MEREVYYNPPVEVIPKKQKQKWLIIVVVLLIFAVIVSLFLFTNTTSLKNGTVYYCADGTSYEYNTKTRLSKKTEIEGYDYVSWYYPTNDGYIAYAGYEDDNRTEVIIKNGKVIFNADAYLTHLNTNGNYLFFTKEDYIFCAINLNTKEEFLINNSLYYGYAFNDKYMYFSEQDPRQPLAERNINIADCTKDKLEVKTIDKGVIIKTSDNALVYSKENKVYEYNFETGNSVETDDYSVAKDTFQNRFLGTLKTDADNADIHYIVVTLPPSNGYPAYENELLNGFFMPTKEHFQLFPTIKISDKRGSMFIPVKRIDVSIERYSVTAYENGEKIYHVKPTCLKWIY